MSKFREYLRAWSVVVLLAALLAYLILGRPGWLGLVD